LASLRAWDGPWKRREEETRRRWQRHVGLGIRRRRKRCAWTRARAELPKADITTIGVDIFRRCGALCSDVLYDLADQRRKANKTPPSIDHCSVSEKQAKALEKVVPDFWWDHDEGHYDNDEVDRKDYYDYDFEFGSYGDSISCLSVGWGELHVRLAQAEWEPVW